MTRELKMPKLSDSMEDAVIVRWLKVAGESFSRGEALAEIETDKATVIYEAESDGVISRLVVEEGGTARVGEPIAALDGEPEITAPAPEASVAVAEPEPAEAPAFAAREGRPRATPVARRRAVELGVSLFGLAGTGPGERITALDVERAASAPPVEDAREIIELTPTQATVARRMALSAAEIPAFTITVEIDVSTLVGLRSGAGGLAEPRPTINDFIVRAAALALRLFPAVNSSFAGGRIERHAHVNVGIAVAVEGALLVPVVVDADRRTMAEIARESRRLVEAARSRSLTPGDLSGGTFTISNLGPFGVHSFTAIVDPPQAAILAVGSAERRAFETETGGIGFRETLFATLSADHRIVYGADAAAFLAHLKRLLEDPMSLLL